MLIVFSGRTASGKSTLAKAAAKALDANTGSFGGYVRHLTEVAGGNPLDRKTLQDLGQSLVEKDPANFVTQFLAFNNYSPTHSILVVDGLRHLTVLDALRSAIAANDKMVLVHVDISDQVRHQRLFARNLTKVEIDEIEQHPSEKDVLLGLSQMADLRLDGNAATENQLELIRTAIGI